MTNAEHEDTRPVPRRRRGLVVVGAAGLAAALGGGAFLVTERVTEPRQQEQQSTAVAGIAPPVPAPSSAAPSPAGPSPDVSASAAVRRTAAASKSEPARTREQRIEAVKGAAAKAVRDKRTVKRALVGHEVADAAVTVQQVGAVKVVSARQDLTGKRELSWVAGQAGEKVGDARCSQSISLSPDVPAKERRTLLLCWRTSAGKSVYTIAVDPKARPSKQRSVAELTRVWSSL